MLIMTIAGSVITIIWGLHCLTIGKRFVASWNKKGVLFCAVFYVIPLILFGYFSEFYSAVDVEAYVINELSMTYDAVNRLANQVMAVWVFGIIVGQGFLFHSCYEARRMTTIGMEIIDGPWLEILEEAKEELGVNREVGLYRFDAASSPCNVGFFRPCIIINCRCLDIQGIRSVIYHELVHIQKHDNFKMFLIKELMYVHWFNPFAHLLRFLYEIWMERTVDEEVLTEYRHIIKKKEYFTTIEYLLELYKERMKKRQKKFVYLVNGARILGWRVDWMKKFKTKSTKKKIVAGLVGAAFLGIGTVSSVSASGLLASAYGNAVREQAVVEEASVAQEDFGECSEEIYTAEPLSGNVVLMDGILTKAVYAYDWAIPSNTTYRSVQGYYKTAGSEITTSVYSTPTDHQVNIGIIQPNGTRRYVAGSGSFAHTFSIKQTGTHYVYAENPSSGTVDVLLTIKY